MISDRWACIFLEKEKRKENYCIKIENRWKVEKFEVGWFNGGREVGVGLQPLLSLLMPKMCGRKHEAMGVDSVHILATTLSKPQNARASALYSSALSLLGISTKSQFLYSLGYGKSSGVPRFVFKFKFWV